MKDNVTANMPPSKLIKNHMKIRNVIARSRKIKNKKNLIKKLLKSS
jgi:hypothetical protein